MKAAAAPTSPPARLVDSVHLMTSSDARALKSAGVGGVAQYLGSVTPSVAHGILDAGLAFLAVTYADDFDGDRAAASLRTLSYPAGACAFLDLEGVGTSISPQTIISRVNAWAAAVEGAGFIPGLYVGAGAQLTSAELEALAVHRYWKGISRVVDRNGALAEPAAGWCLWQIPPGNQLCDGLLVDHSVAGLDYMRRPLVWAVAD